MKLIDNAHTTILAKMMDVYSLRNKITASNVANLDTPGYQKKTVRFEEELADKINSGQRGKEAIRELNPSIQTLDEKPVLEDELLEMSDTQMRVQLVSRTLRHNYEQMRMGITGRPG